MSAYIQVFKLSRWSPGGLQFMSVLKAQVQSWMASEKVYWDPWKQDKVNLFCWEWYLTMIYDILKIFSQNFHKNSLIVNTILETQMSFDIIFIQEPPWSTICTILSSMNCKGEELVGVPHHPNWLTFTRSLTNQSDFPRVLTYINIQISSLCFSLWNNILNHRDVSCIFFFNQGFIFFLINVYSDSSQSALKYLKNTETNIHNIIIMTGDFNIRDSLWDSNFPFHSVYSDMLFNIADSFSIALSKPTENFSTRFLDNNQNLNLVLVLVFTRPSSAEFNRHHIHLD